MSSSNEKSERGDCLNDSWVELHFHNQSTRPERSFMKPSTTQNMSNAMEKLLIEAQKEGSRASSCSASNRGSPLSPHSPNNESVGPPIRNIKDDVIQQVECMKSSDEIVIPTDWIWDWSSRPEAIPPSEHFGKFKHPRKPKLSVRNTRVMQGGTFCLENLPVLFFSHACTFFFGAAAMLIYLKKCCNWSAVVAPSGIE